MKLLKELGHSDVGTVPSERNSYFGVGGGGGGGEEEAAHCFPSHSVHCCKGNIIQFENYWGAPAPQPPGSDRPEVGRNLKGGSEIDTSRL